MFNKVNAEVSYCMQKNDAAKMWRYLQRFPHYDELKELHNKFLPEMAKAEQSISNFKDEIQKHQIIIR